MEADGRYIWAILAKHDFFSRHFTVHLVLYKSSGESVNQNQWKLSTIWTPLSEPAEEVANAGNGNHLQLPMAPRWITVKYREIKHFTARNEWLRVAGWTGQNDAEVMTAASHQLGSLSDTMRHRGTKIHWSWPRQLHDEPMTLGMPFSWCLESDVALIAP